MQVKTLIKKLPLSLSPHESYRRLTHDSGTAHTALLETAEAGTHQHRKSIVMLSAAAKISCTDRKININALNENGEFFIQSYDESGLEGFDIHKTDKSIDIKLQKIPSNIDESVRLKETSTLHILRNINDQLANANDSHEMSSCLIGAFSFDYVDQFESLTAIGKLDEDYCFYLADQRLIQTVDNQSAQIVVNGFGENANNTIRLGLHIDDIERALEHVPVGDKELVSNIINNSPDHQIETNFNDAQDMAV